MLVVKTSWILSFILEDRATHCSRQSDQHREQELRGRARPS